MVRSRLLLILDLSMGSVSSCRDSDSRAKVVEPERQAADTQVSVYPTGVLHSFVTTILVDRSCRVSETTQTVPGNVMINARVSS